MKRKELPTIKEYIGNYPEDVAKKLNQIYKLIQKLAPQATEKISWGMPTFQLDGNLIHFAGYKHHIGLYPTPSAINTFADKLKDYKTSKGGIQFPLNQPLPEKLITEIIKFRVEESQNKR